MTSGKRTALPLATDHETIPHSTEPGNTVHLTMTNQEHFHVAYKIRCTNNSLFKIEKPTGLLAPGGSFTTTLTLIQTPVRPWPESYYVVFSIYTDESRSKIAWAKATEEGTQKELPVKWQMLDDLTPVQGWAPPDDQKGEEPDETDKGGKGKTRGPADEAEGGARKK